MCTRSVGLVCNRKVCGLTCAHRFCVFRARLVPARGQGLRCTANGPAPRANAVFTYGAQHTGLALPSSIPATHACICHWDVCSPSGGRSGGLAAPASQKVRRTALMRCSADVPGRTRRLGPTPHQEVRQKCSPFGAGGPLLHWTTLVGETPREPYNGSVHVGLLSRASSGGSVTKCRARTCGAS